MEFCEENIDWQQRIENDECRKFEGKEEKEEIGLLPEDHPLLQKFQQSLKDHLLRVQTQLLEEIQDLERAIKTKEQEREDIGCELYDLQQNIRQQNSTLDDFTKQIQTISEKRIKKENDIKILRKQYDEQISLSKEAKNYHKSRLIELASLQALEMNIQKWSKEIENDVATAQRIVSKDNQDQKQIAEDKRKTDMLLFNLNSEIRKREQELNSITDQIKEQRSLLEVLNNSLSDANADIEALQKEQKRLTQAWSEVIIAIDKRDKILYQSKERLIAELDKQKSTAAAIEATKKAIAKEMEQNEKLEGFKTRILEDFENIQIQDNKEVDVISKLESQLDQIQAIIIQTESDLKASKEEGNYLTVQLRLIQSKIDKEAQRKQKLEDEIFKFNENQITADKNYIYRMKILKEIQTQRRQIEEKITTIEKQLSIMIFGLEKLKGTILKLQEENDRLHKIQDEMKSQAEQYEDQIKETKNEIQIKQKSLDVFKKKLEELIEATGGKEMSAIEKSIDETDKQIQDINKEIQKAQTFWLTQQSKLVNLSEKRAAQIKEIQLVRKRNSIARLFYESFEF